MSDPQPPVLHGAVDPDPRSASVEGLRGLVDRLFPDRTQVVEVDDRVAGHCDLCPAEAELQLNVDNRVLDDCTGQIKVDLAVLGVDLENSRYPPCTAPAKPTGLPAKVRVRPVSVSGSEAMTGTRSPWVVAVRTTCR